MGGTSRAPRVTLEVTADLIAASTERDSSHCMLAEAVRAAVPDAQRISVDLQTIRFSDPRKRLRYTYLTPRRGQVALVDFDQGVKPEPFNIQLRGGQVTRMFQKTEDLQRVSTEKRSLSDAELAQRRTASQTMRLRKAELRAPGSGHPGVPDRVGGRTPPTTPFARRRAFGLRALRG